MPVRAHAPLKWVWMLFLYAPPAFVPAWSELDIRDGSRAANRTPVSRYHESPYRYVRYYRKGHMLLADLACWVFRLVQVRLAPLATVKRS